MRALEGLAALAAEHDHAQRAVVGGHRREQQRALSGSPPSSDDGRRRWRAPWQARHMRQG
jgi:hypothetical protein